MREDEDALVRVVVDALEDERLAWGGYELDDVLTEKAARIAVGAVLAALNESDGLVPDRRIGQVPAPDGSGSKLGELGGE